MQQHVLWSRGMRKGVSGRCLGRVFWGVVSSDGVCPAHAVTPCMPSVNGPRSNLKRQWPGQKTTVSTHLTLAPKFGMRIHTARFLAKLEPKWTEIELGFRRVQEWVIPAGPVEGGTAFPTPVPSASVASPGEATPSTRRAESSPAIHTPLQGDDTYG